MRRFTFCCVGVALLALSSTAQATTFSFDTDPFAGTSVLTTPGRQVVGGELFLPFFSTANDVFAFDATVFGVGGPVRFVNDVAANLPADGVNVVVLRSFDDDANLLTPFGAGSAANLIADRITTPGAGFFIYFNQGLDLARLVYSTDLNDRGADLKILARMLTPNGQAGRDAMATFTSTNFDITGADATPVPEPTTLSMLAMGVVGVCGRVLRRTRGRG